MVQVKISDGILKGEFIKDDLVHFYSFKGIPFAAPPVGELRFKAPQPVQPWKGVRLAKEFGSICYQFDPLTKKLRGSEDCLFLNVYSPKLQPDKPLPVMVFIHGGSFTSGSGNDDLYGPEFLLRQGVILVTLNYRLEVLGFLCLDTEEVPGNAGMKDQVAALRWVQKNISNFGGDPNNVTIFGESAGGACITGHLLSPMSKGLFKRAIAQSGCITSACLNPWGPFQSALSLARKFGFYSEDKKELYAFFKNLPLRNLIGNTEPITLYDVGKGTQDMKFSIVLEKDFGQERFYVGDAYDLLRNGKLEGVDVMLGYTEDEGVFMAKAIGNVDELIQKLKHYDDYLVPSLILPHSSQATKFEVGRKLKKYYFGKKYEICAENIGRLFKFFSIDIFVYGIIQWAKISSNAKKNNSYLYKFTCKSERNVMSRVFGVTKYLGDREVVCHADDLPYLFSMKKMGLKVNKEAETFKVIDRITKLWTNFAKAGNPTPDGSLGVTWNTYDVENQHYLEIGNQLKACSAPDEEEVAFWEDIFREFCPKYLFQGSS